MTSVSEPLCGAPTPAHVHLDPRGARWAYLSAATGTAANVLLAAFFAAMPAAGRENPLGAANDIVGSLATACMVPAAVAVGRRLPRPGPLRRLHLATLGALGVATAAGPLLVAGVLPFPVSATASTAAFGVLVTWVGLGSSWLGRHGDLPRSTSRLGVACAWATLVGVLSAAASLVVPGPLDVVLLAVGGTAVSACWLAVPAWWLLVGRWLGEPPTGGPGA